MRLRASMGVLAATGLCFAILTRPAVGQLLGGRDDTPGLQVFTDCPFCPEMVIVPPGTFTMGASEDDPDAAPDELPRHDVSIAASVAVGRTEVTFAQWDACVARGGCAYRPSDLDWGRGEMPVINVSWEDANAYLVWLSGVTGAPYRLPSEAEWEYVARAGASAPYPWTGGPAGACAHANVADQSALTEYPDWAVVPCDDGYAVNAPVGQFRANRFGLFDVIGNVWEWVADCWNPTYRGAPTDGAAWTVGECRQRVLRGGAATGIPSEARLSQRGVNDSNIRAAFNGFRVALTIVAE